MSGAGESFHSPTTRDFLADAVAGASAGLYCYFFVLYCFLGGVVGFEFCAKVWEFGVQFEGYQGFSWFFIVVVLLGAIAAIFVCPLDVIKTRLQVHGLPQVSQASRRG